MTTRKSTLGLSVVDAGTTTLVYASGTLDIATVDQFEACALVIAASVGSRPKMGWPRKTCTAVRTPVCCEPARAFISSQPSYPRS